MEQFVIGFIRGAHGVTGNFKVESASGEHEHFAKLSEVTLRDGRTGASKSYIVEDVKIGMATLFMKLAGINTPEDVKHVNGWEIVVPRGSACPLQKNEWYVEDLKGCTLVYTEQGAVGTAQAVGMVTDVVEGGTGNLLQVALAEKCALLAENVRKTAVGKTRTVLVPFIDEFIGMVDVQRKVLQLMHLWILE